MFELRDSRGVIGSFDSAGIRRLATEGRLGSEMEVRELPSGKWHPISKLKNLPASTSARCAAKPAVSEPKSDRSFESIYQDRPAALAPVWSRLPEDRKFALAGFFGFLLGVAIGAVYTGRGYSVEAYQEQVNRASRAETELSAVRTSLQSADAQRERPAVSSILRAASTPTVEASSSLNVPGPAAETDQTRTFTDKMGNTMTESEVTAAFATIRARIESKEDPYVKAYLEGVEKALLNEQAKIRAGSGR